MLKQVLSALRMMVVTDSVNIPFVRTLLDEEGRFKPNELVDASATAMLDELARWTEALRPLRPA
jgi:NAD(P)H-dependent FMN reductase